MVTLKVRASHSLVVNTFLEKNKGGGVKLIPLTHTFLTLHRRKNHQISVISEAH